MIIITKIDNISNGEFAGDQFLIFLSFAIERFKMLRTVQYSYSTACKHILET